MDEQPVSIKVDATAKFQKKIKNLEKKYRNIKDDVRPIVESLAIGELPGDRIADLNLEIYKVRMNLLAEPLQCQTSVFLQPKGIL